MLLLEKHSSAFALQHTKEVTVKKVFCHYLVSRIMNILLLPED